MFSDPLGCWRRVSVREKKTKIDWALEVGILLEKDYPSAEKVKLVCDNLSVHAGIIFFVFGRIVCLLGFAVNV